MFLLQSGCLFGCSFSGTEVSGDNIPNINHEQHKNLEKYSEPSFSEEKNNPTEKKLIGDGNAEEATPSTIDSVCILPRLISPKSSDFVAVSDYIPSVSTELKYAASDNFTSQVIYEFRDAFLRYGTVKKLQAVSDELAAQGFRLKIWDAFRPVSAQFKLWEAFPDDNYVANPTTGHSNHNRGNAVDLTLTDLQGNELTMPSAFDDFSALADRDYSDCPEDAAKNALLLEAVMERQGFVGYDKEWWHYADMDSYPVEEHFDPAVISRWYANCKEFISLRSAPSTAADVITRIPVNEEFLLLGWDCDFALVDYNGLRGYVLSSYIQPVTSRQNESTPSRWYAKCNEYISLRSAPSTSASVITRILVNEEFLLLDWLNDFALVDYNGLKGYVLTSYIQPVEARHEQLPPLRWVANCEEYISLRSAPDSTEVISKITTGETVILNQWVGRYALVTYGSKQGYVLSSYIRPENIDYFQTVLNVVKPTDCYTYEQMLADMKVLSANYPQLIAWERIGTSELGRDIPIIRLGNLDAQYHVLLQGAIHGREHMTAWLLMAMVEDWTQRIDGGFQSFEDICFHIIPMSNPDGVAITQSGLLNSEQMAIYQRDVALGYTNADSAQYARRWKANGLGIDLNRNFPAGWDSVGERTQPSSQQYRGIAPFSASEARALRDYTLKYSFAATVSYHATGSEIYYQYGEQQPVNSQSEGLGKAIGAITGYELIESSGVVGAGYKDWAIDVMGIPSLTIEIGCQDAPLAERELYSVFARNREVLFGIAQWLKS